MVPIKKKISSLTPTQSHYLTPELHGEFLAGWQWLHLNTSLLTPGSWTALSPCDHKSMEVQQLYKHTDHTHGRGQRSQGTLLVLYFQTHSTRCAIPSINTLRSIPTATPEGRDHWSRSVVSDSLRPRGLQPTRLLCPWESPGTNTGVGCHSFSRGSSRPRDQTRSPALEADTLTSEPSGKPLGTNMLLYGL